MKSEPQWTYNQSNYRIHCSCWSWFNCAFVFKDRRMRKNKLPTVVGYSVVKLLQPWHLTQNAWEEDFQCFVVKMLVEITIWMWFRLISHSPRYHPIVYYILNYADNISTNLVIANFRYKSIKYFLYNTEEALKGTVLHCMQMSPQLVPNPWIFTP